MYFGQVVRQDDKLKAYIGKIDCVDSFITVDNFIAFANEMLKDTSVFCREKEQGKVARDHSDESVFDHVECEYEDEGGTELMLKIYTKDEGWCEFEDENWEAWIAYDNTSRPMMVCAKEFMSNNLQTLSDKMKERESHD